MFKDAYVCMKLWKAAVSPWACNFNAVETV